MLKAEPKPLGLCATQLVLVRWVFAIRPLSANIMMRSKSWHPCRYGQNYDARWRGPRPRKDPWTHYWRHEPLSDRHADASALLAVRLVLGTLELICRSSGGAHQATPTYARFAANHSQRRDRTVLKSPWSGESRLSLSSPLDRVPRVPASSPGDSHTIVDTFDPLRFY